MSPIPDLDHDYVTAFPELAVRTDPERHPDLSVVALNEDLASEMGLDSTWLQSAHGAQFLAGHATPTFATAYAGHQFGSFSPLLGDGRALLLGRIHNPSQPATHSGWELMAKGTGPTAFSRRGDGRMVLGPALREFLVSEALHALGIPTARCLAVLTTGSSVMRHTLEPRAIVVRAAQSHLRVGTFEYAARTRQDPQLVDRLITYCQQLLYQTTDSTTELFSAVYQRQAKLVSEWMRVGFVHGVLNTDNTSLAGETLDLGPCAFADTNIPETVFSSIDSGGRYALGNQVAAVEWNLARWAETLLPRLDIAQTQELLYAFPEAVRQHLGADASLLKEIEGTGMDILAYRRDHGSPKSPWYIPRNWHVEAALQQALAGDFTEFARLYDAVTHPYTWDAAYTDLVSGYRDGTEGASYTTFCGT